MAERRRLLRESREVHSADEVLYVARETRRREVEEVMAWVFEGGLTLAPLQPSVVACVAPGIADSLQNSPRTSIDGRGAAAATRAPRGRTIPNRARFADTRHDSIDVKDGPGGGGNTNKYHSKSLDPAALSRTAKSPRGEETSQLVSSRRERSPSPRTRKSNERQSFSPQAVVASDQDDNGSPQSRSAPTATSSPEESLSPTAYQQRNPRNRLSDLSPDHAETKGTVSPESGRSENLSPSATASPPPTSDSPSQSRHPVKSVRWQLDIPDSSGKPEASVHQLQTPALQQAAGEMMTGGKRKSSGSRIKAWIDKKLSCESDGGGSSNSSFEEGLFSPPGSISYQDGPSHKLEQIAENRFAFGRPVPGPSYQTSGTGSPSKTGVLKSYTPAGVHQVPAPTQALPSSGCIPGATVAGSSGTPPPVAAFGVLGKKHFIPRTLFSHHSMDDTRMPWSIRRRVRHNKQTNNVPPAGATGSPATPGQSTSIGAAAGPVGAVIESEAHQQTRRSSPLRNVVEKRRLFRLRRQTNSAPVSVDDGTQSPPPAAGIGSVISGGLSSNAAHNSTSGHQGSATLNSSSSSSSSMAPPWSKCSSSSSLPRPKNKRVTSYLLDTALTASTLLTWDTIFDPMTISPEYTVPNLEKMLGIGTSSSWTAPGKQQQQRSKSCKRLVRSRDAGRGPDVPYMNLPSPNVGAEDRDPRSSFAQASTTPCEEEEEDVDESEDVTEMPDPSSLSSRRRALLPPKFPPEATESEDDGSEKDRSSRGSTGSGEGMMAPRKRSSSIVVIPPMQVCPGDLMVYSKVLTQKRNLMTSADLAGSTTSLAVTDDAVGSRKGKTTWSLLKLFERHHRPKAQNFAELAEVLSLLKPTEWGDAQLAKHRATTWHDFVYSVHGSSSDDEGKMLLTPSARRKKLSADYPRRSKGSITPPGGLLIEQKEPEGDDDEEDTTPTASTTTQSHNTLDSKLRMSSNVLSPTGGGAYGSSVHPQHRGSYDLTHHLPPSSPQSIQGSDDEHSGSGCGGKSNRLSIKQNPNHPTVVVSTPTHQRKDQSPNRCGFSRTGSAGKDEPPKSPVPPPEPEKPAPSKRPLLRQRSFGSFKLKKHGKVLQRRETVQNMFLNLLPNSASSTAAQQAVLDQQAASGKLSAMDAKNKSSSMADKLSSPTPHGSLLSPRSSIPTTTMEEPCQTSIEEAAALYTQRCEQKRKDALWDLFQSELAFLYDHLMVLKNVFMEPLKKIQVEGFAMFAEPELLFGNLDELCCVTYAFCKEFMSTLIQHVTPSGKIDVAEVLVKLFLKSGKANQVSGAYHRYTLNYINALNYLETLRRQNEFNEFEKWCSKDRRCKKLQLTDLLVAPVQHITKLPLILRDVESCTEDPEERALVQEILEKQENSLRELDDKMKWLKNFERLLEIQRNIVWPSVMDMEPKSYVPECLKATLAKQPCERLIVSPRRQIIIEGLLILLDSGKASEVHVILFDDMLLITRRKKALHKKKSSISDGWPSSCRTLSNAGNVVGGGGESGFGPPGRYVVYRQPLSLDRFMVHDVPPNEMPHSFAIVSLNRFQQIVAVHTLQATSDEAKITWIAKLKESQMKWRRTLQSTVFRNHRISNASALTMADIP